MMYKLFITTLLCVVAVQTQCSLQEKITKAAEKISTLRQNVKSGKDLNVTKLKCGGGHCGGSKCCGNSCGRCSKCGHK